MGNRTQEAVAHYVTPLLSIKEGGSTDVESGADLLMSGTAVSVDSPKVAFDVLRALGCSEEHANRRINYALTGEWPGSM